MTSEYAKAQADAYRNAAHIVGTRGHGHPFCGYFVGEFNEMADELDAKAAIMDDLEKSKVPA